MAKLRSTDVNGNLFVSGQLKLTNPFLISTNALITNLNADLLDGYHANDLIIRSTKCYDTSTSDTADGKWTVSIPGITELTEGLTIKIRIKRAGASTCTLNLNGFGAKTVYLRYGTKLTTHYAKESVLALTYTSDAVSSGTDRSGWIVENYYDSTDIDNLRTYSSRYIVKNTLYRYRICFVNKDDQLIPSYHGGDNDVSTNKTLTTESFMPEKGIYFYYSSITVQAGSYPANGTLYTNTSATDMRYSFNTGPTLITDKPVYLVVTPQSDGQVKLASTPIVQALPTTENSNYYIYLGQPYDNYRLSLVVFHPIFKWNKKTSSFTTDSVEASDSISSLNTSVTTLNGYFTNGIAKKATADASGNVITSTYVKKAGDTMTGGLSPATNKGASLGTSSLYWNNIYGTTLYENGTSLADKYASKTNLPEAYLTWGGRNLSNSYGPIDAAMVPALGANRLAFTPSAAIEVEYSRDNGATWTDYELSNTQKTAIFSGPRVSTSVVIGKPGSKNTSTGVYDNASVNNRARITISTDTANIYTVLNKFIIYCSTEGSVGCKCTIDGKTKANYDSGNDTWTTFANEIPIEGWSGYNVINVSGIVTYGGYSNQYVKLRFTFYCTDAGTMATSGGLTIYNIYGFGGVGWREPSNMAVWGQIYTYDSSQNVTFPANITSGTIVSYNVKPRANKTYSLGTSSTYWNDIYGTTLYENGIALTNKYVKKVGDTMSGALTPSTNKGASLGSSSLYWNNIYGTTIYEDGTALTNKYAPKSHTHDKSEVGLGNVDNTADANKSVKYATTAGSANSVAWDNVKNKPTEYTPASHNHDDRYYTESEIDSKLNGKANSSHTHSYLPLSGGKLTGALNFNNNTWNLVGDDVYIGDYNQGGSLGIKGANGQTNIGFVNQSNDYYIKLASPGVTANRTITMPDDTGTMALTKDVVPKKYNNKFYPFIGSYYGKPNYKVTLPISGYTSSGHGWMMISMELILGGSYDGGTNGRIFLSYYFLKDPQNNWSANDVRAIGIGNRLADNSVSIQYNISNPGIFYIHANNGNYNSFSIQNLTARDSAENFDFTKTTIEAVDSIPSGLRTVPLTCLDSKGDNKLYVNNTAVSLDGHTHNYLSNVATISGGNTANYPWRRIMSIPSTTSNWVDVVGTYYLSGNYHGGPYYLFRVAFRTNFSTNGALGNFQISVIATNSDPTNLAIASYSVAANNVTTSYSDIFVKVPSYPRMTLTRLSPKDIGTINYYNSNEGNDASSRTEAYTAINGSGTGYASYELHSLSAYTYVFNGELSSKVGYAKSADRATSDGDGNVITNTYVKKAGDNMTKALTLPENSTSLKFRTPSDYETGTFYGTSGNEALTFYTKSSNTSFQFINGSKPESSNSWQTLTPALQIKDNKVAINKLLGEGEVPNYTLDVDGIIYASNDIISRGCLDLANTNNGIKICKSTKNSTPYFITNIEAGSKEVTLAGNNGAEANVDVTYNNGSKGNGKWYIVATAHGSYCDTVSVGIENESNTGFKIWVRNVYAAASRTLKIHWIAIKYY